jgi:D-xylose transport system substrate-binding protein
MKARILFAVSSIFVAIASGQAMHAQSSQKPQIGFSLEAVKGERWQTDLDSFEARARQLGVEVISADAGGDDDLQFRQVKEMIKAGVKVLVLLPRDTTNASRMVDAAEAAHVKVISYDRLILNSDVDLYISFDPVEIGRMQADYLVNLAPNGNYVVIAGSPNDANAKLLHDEQIKVLQPYIDRGDIKLLADSYTREWLPEEAYLHMLNAIDSSKGNITAVLASNDGLAGGVIQALKDNKLEGKVLVSGQDADLAAIIRIIEGTQSMTVYKSITNQAALAADEAARLAKGESINEDRTIYNGRKNVPAIMLKCVTLTKDNIKTTVIQDGFQKLEVINAALPENKRLPN